MTDADLVYLDTRLAGEVIRYHTWPQIRQQSVGEHSWQLLRIYTCVTDKVDPDFMLHCIYHDTAEISTGDIPYPVKSLNGDLKEQMDKLEKESIARQAGYWDPVIGKNLSGEQRQLFKLIELVEMAEWGIEEVLRGSQYGEIVADRCLKAVYTQMLAVNPLPLSWERLACYIQKRIERLSLEGTEDWWIPDKWNLKEIKDV